MIAQILVDICSDIVDNAPSSSDLPAFFHIWVGHDDMYIITMMSTGQLRCYALTFIPIK